MVIFAYGLSFKFYLLCSQEKKKTTEETLYIERNKSIKAKQNPLKSLTRGKLNVAV